MKEMPPEVRDIATAVWQRACNWQAPPHWQPEQFQDELWALAQAAAYEAFCTFDPQRGVPLEAFVFVRVLNALRTFYRQEWLFARLFPLQKATKKAKLGNLTFVRQNWKNRHGSRWLFVGHWRN